jgi:hypothetical protein
MTTQRAKIAEEIGRRLAAALRGAQLYSPDHPLVTRSVSALAEAIAVALAANPTLTIGIVEDDLVSAMCRSRAPQRRWAN